MDEHRQEREELAAIERDDIREHEAAEREYWEDVGLEHAERVTLETVRWSR